MPLSAEFEVQQLEPIITETINQLIKDKKPIEFKCRCENVSGNAIPDDINFKETDIQITLSYINIIINKTKGTLLS